ncbi:lipid A biosynthesis lauroyl acyltransferase [Citrobacter amalonaticus]|nr:lipid A biosynthesis lauroyl acyltransferase [Citrobacter amalonaticus]
MTNLPKFSAALLHPRYWLTWLGIGALWLVVQLPYPILYRLGHMNRSPGVSSDEAAGRKLHIVTFELCFPEMSERDRHAMVVKNFESVGMGLLETGMAWFWSDRRIAR